MSDPRSRLAEAVAKALHDLSEDSTYFIEWESESEADRGEYRTQADAVLPVFAQWLRARAAWSAGEAERVSKADDFPDHQLARDHAVAEMVLTAAADAIMPKGRMK
ncbi:MAG TPA: hypothetical protein VFY84_18590 [Jiangellales bacterium]|nr:hypothetical protein [Jiangellales bacterium]